MTPITIDGITYIPESAPDVPYAQVCKHCAFEKNLGACTSANAVLRKEHSLDCYQLDWVFVRGPKELQP